MHAKGIDHHEDDADERNKDHIDGRRDKPFHVASNFLQLAQGLSATLVFEDLIRQIQRVLDSVGVHFRAQSLDDQILGYAGHKSHTHRRQQQKPSPSDELRLGVLVILGRVSIDDVAENDRVKKRKDLISRSQQ